jgi:hypothetical protein
MTTREARARAKAKANTGVLRCAQNDIVFFVCMGREDGNCRGRATADFSAALLTIRL